MTPRVYVGTYAKYNSGSLEGKWLELDKYTGQEDFLEACRELHSDEEDPEFMFQDFEGFPRPFYEESEIDERLWEWIDAPEYDRMIWEAYMEHVDSSASLEQARDACLGIYPSPEDWAEDYLDESGALEDVPDSLRNYIDFEAYARDCGYNGMSFVECDDGVVVFNNC